jgi:hypothetical protein
MRPISLANSWLLEISSPRQAALLEDIGMGVIRLAGGGSSSLPPPVYSSSRRLSGLLPRLLQAPEWGMGVLRTFS